MITLMEFLSYAFLLLIGIGYYYDFRQNPKQFKADIKGGTFYLLGILIIILLERILFTIGIIYIVLQIAVLILISFLIKSVLQKGK
ncbi:hypothetical protein [Kordia jejudonensis]|uniref:hypothetical protein n=1 Tax=Kordia jejudonensis TaxID=1348245 RepID=UPI0006298414|nr:hypothetical protein [Kordia jejudonensis]